MTHETYKIDNVRKPKDVPSVEVLRENIKNAKPNSMLKKLFNPLLG